MTTTNSIVRHSAAKPAKPEKPRADFPLFPHASGRWAKKINQRMWYFGSWADGWEAALAKYEEEGETIAKTGRRPQRMPGKLTVAQLVNRFLDAKEQLVNTGEFSARTFRDYHYTTDRIVAMFGGSTAVESLAPDDFLRLKKKLAETLSLTSLTTEIAKIRAIFNWGADEDNGLLEKPVRFGKEFRIPSKKAVKLAKQTNGSSGTNGTKSGRMFERKEILAMLESASMPFKAMILLAVNVAFGNNDLATLRVSAIDLDGGWIEHPRPKTGVHRRAPLWPETVALLREALANRPKPKNPRDADLAFLTKSRQPWVRLTKKAKSDTWADATWSDSIVSSTRCLLKRLKLRQRGFYSLRHTFLTIADEAKDTVAASLIMGHTDASMASHYRERISDERLLAVSNHVRAWLFPGEDGGEVEGGTPKD